MTAKQYRALRIARGTQAEVAKLLGIDVMTISRRERGELPINKEAEMALRAVNEGTTVSGSGMPGIAAIAVPVSAPGGARAAAVAAVSLASVDQLRTKGRQVTLWFTPAAILVLTLLVDWLGRRLIHRLRLRRALLNQERGEQDVHRHLQKLALPVLKDG